MKRIYDIIFAVVGILIFSPLFIIISIIILIEDRKFIFFAQKRLGKDKIIFSMIKFRTMQDNKVTIVGKWLRKTGLDEIPQFINVLKGDMSMVGPRPLTKEEVIQMRWDNSEYDIRWMVSPGITGLAQLFCGTPNRTSWFLDKKYIEIQNICLDTWIIILSFVVNIIGKQKVRRYLWKRER